MLQNSFLFLPKCNIRTQHNFYKQGITTWNQFLEKKRIHGLSKPRKLLYDLELKKAKQALYNQDISFFTTRLQQKYHYLLLKHTTPLFLDIEATKTQPTIVGLSNGEDTYQLVQGKNLSKHLFSRIINQHSLLVTFNGSSFDLPMLTKHFNYTFTIPHIDLKHLTAKCDLTGGLKAIEKKLNIKRPKHTQIKNGDPIKLWRVYKATNDPYYLQILLDYNAQDLIHLEHIMHHCLSKITRQARQERLHCLQAQDQVLQ